MSTTLAAAVVPAATAELLPYAGAYTTTTGNSWGSYFSPVVIHNDGTLEIAGTPIPATFDASTETLSFNWIPIKETKAMGQITLTQDSFSGTITPDPQMGSTTITGTLSVSLPTPSLENLQQVNELFQSGQICYLRSTVDGKWIAVEENGKSLQAAGAVPLYAQPFQIQTEAGGFYLTIGGSQYVTNGASGLYIYSDPSQAVLFSVYASMTGYAAFGANGQYCTLSDNSLVLASAQTLSPSILFEVLMPSEVQPAPAAPAAIPDAATLSACDIAIAGLVWQVTGGLFLAIGLGPYISSGNVATGLVGLIQSSSGGRAALNALLNGMKKNPGTSGVITLTLSFLTGVYDAGLLWSVVKFVLSTLGWWALFRALAKILEIMLLPEVEAADLLASFAVWSAQAVQSGLKVASDCKS